VFIDRRAFFTRASTSATATRIFAAPPGGSRHGELVQVAGVVVVDRSPEEVSQIGDRAVPADGRIRDPGEFFERPGREIRQHTAFEHRQAGDPSQGSALAVCLHLS
jgi:hypothetical protein